MFTERQLEIVKLLIENKNYLTGSEIASAVKISIKTFQKEMKYIRSILNSFDIHVFSQRGKGYSIRMDSKIQSEVFLNSISYFSKNSIHNNFDSEFILLSIIEKIYFKQENINLAYLEDKMFIGKKYLLKCIEKTKPILDRHAITLKLKKGKGLLLEGSLFNIEMLYTDLLEVIDNRILYGNLFQPGDYLLHIQPISAILDQYHLSVSYMNSKKICLFLSVQLRFQNVKNTYDPQDDNDSFNIVLEKSVIGQAMWEIMDLYQLDNENALHLNACKVLLCFIDKTALDQYYTLIGLSINFKPVLDRTIQDILLQSASLFSLSCHDVVQNIAAVLTVNLLEQKLGIQTKFRNFENLGGKTMICELVSGNILFCLEKELGLTFSIDILAEIKLLLRSYTVKFSKSPNRKLVVISKKSFSISDYIAKNLEHNYAKFVTKIIPQLHSNQNIAPNDLVVTDIPIEQFQYSDHVLFFTSLSNFQEVDTSVKNYLNFSNLKNQAFFIHLNLSYLNTLLDCPASDYLTASLNFPACKNHHNEIQKSIILQSKYHIFIKNNILMLILIHEKTRTQIIPLLHPQPLVLNDVKIKLTLIVKVSSIPEFISIDEPLYNLFHNNEFSKFISEDELIEPENFEQKLNELIY